MSYSRLPIPILILLVLILGTGNALIYHALLAPKSPALTVSVLDIGQGDAILVEGPTGRQMLIDGGKDRKVLRELPRALPLLDRTLDLVVATHPDADHIGGLADIFARYRVGTYLKSSVIHESSATDRLDAASSQERGLATVVARAGMRIHLGGGAYADVLFPDRDMPDAETNAASIVMRIAYGETSFMLTGDAPSEVEAYLIQRYGEDALDSDVLKAGHHGLRTSTSPAWLAAVTPDLAVISAGRGNSYGHPHQEVLDRLRLAGVPFLSTQTAGTITLISDGTLVRQK
ncbi:MAG TPA: ComEC/Rec2 family competence protein [Candidatus Paceibacterota bacterium]|nr:ComEC/Rec2 family competence protein [Candidatus Paceibacterota bacterium]